MKVDLEGHLEDQEDPWMDRWMVLLDNNLGKDQTIILTSHDDSNDGPKNVNDSEKPESVGLLGSNPGGPGGPFGGQGRSGGPPGGLLGPGGPPPENEFKDHEEFPAPPPGFFGDSKPSRGGFGGPDFDGGRGGGGFRGGNQDEFFGGQDGFFRGRGGRGGRGRGGFGGQDFDEGFGGRGGGGSWRTRTWWFWR